MSTWERICIGTSCDLEFILSQSLWNNYFAGSEGKTISSKRLESKGILIFADLIDDDGKFSSWENCRENLICQLLIFLNGMDVCTPFLENGKTELKKTHFYLKLWINKHCQGFIMVSSRAHLFTIFLR